MNPFVKFMVSSSGRAARIVAGAALIGGGALVIGGAAGLLVAVVGVVPLLAGIFDFCIFAPLFGYSLIGTKTRAAS